MTATVGPDSNAVAEMTSTAGRRLGLGPARDITHSG